MQCADPAAAVKGPEGEGKAEPAAAGKSGGRGAKGWQYRWARRAGGCEAAAVCGARGGAGALRGDCSGWGGGGCGLPLCLFPTLPFGCGGGIGGSVEAVGVLLR